MQAVTTTVKQDHLMEDPPVHYHSSSNQEKINILIHIDVFYARLFIRDPQVVNLDQRPKNFRD